MKVELENDLRQITQVIYCVMGEKELKQLIELIKPFCRGKESKEMLKIIENEKELTDERIERLSKCCERYIVSEEEIEEAMKKL